MASSEEASKCIQHLHRTELHGRMISVEKAKNEPSVPLRKADAKSSQVSKKVAALVKEPKSEAKAAAPVEEKKTEKENKEVVQTEVIEKEKKKTAEEEHKTEDKEKKLEKSKAKELKESKKRTVSKERVAKSRSASRERARAREFRRPFFRRPFINREGHPMMRQALMMRNRARNILTFKKIKEEQFRQRQRERERELREVERRRQQEIFRQREIERKQREEAIRLERERERLRIEREKLEREKAEVLRLEREKQRLERERLEREREEIRRREHFKMDESRRGMKRPFESRGTREGEPFWEERKRSAVGGPSRYTDFDHRDRSSYEGRGPESFERKVDRYDRREGRPSMDSNRAESGRFDESIRRDVGRDRDDRRVIERGGRDMERYNRGTPRDADLRGRERESMRVDRTISMRERVSPGPRRPPPREDWKSQSQDRRGHDISRDRPDRRRVIRNLVLCRTSDRPLIH